MFHQLKDKSVLLILDNVEAELIEEQTMFKKELSNILDECPNVRVLIASEY